MKKQATRPARSYERRVQILKILKTHGPLSIKGISAIIEPPMANRRLQDALKRLAERDLVTIRYQKIFRGTGVFYQIAQDEKSRIEAADILSCDAVQLYQPQYRFRELLHSEQCALWAHRIGKLFPTAKVVREYEFKYFPIVSKVLSSVHSDYDLRPDILLIFNEKDAKNYVVVAVEIEKVLKSKERLERKLHKLVSRSFLDGLIYVCDSDQIAQSLKLIYSSKVLARSLRVKTYGHNFLLFTAGHFSSENIWPKMFNANFEPVDLDKWMQKLCTVDVRKRVDSQFEVSALRC